MNTVICPVMGIGTPAPNSADSAGFARKRDFLLAPAKSEIHHWTLVSRAIIFIFQGPLQSWAIAFR
jgi:hypothetical protein